MSDRTAQSKLSWWIRLIDAHQWVVDVRQVLPTIRVPTLVLHPRDDRFVTVEHGRYLATHIPGARVVELAGATISSSSVTPRRCSTRSPSS